MYNFFGFSDSAGLQTSESNGHTQNGDTTERNGVEATTAGTTIKNERIQLDKTDQEIVRLIGQHLKIVGLE